MSQYADDDSASGAPSELELAWQAFASKHLPNAQGALSKLIFEHGWAAHEACPKPIPFVVVDLNGGLIQDVRSSVAARVVILDADVEDLDEDRIKIVEGVECTVSDSLCAPDPDLSSLVAELDELTEDKDGTAEGEQDANP